MIDASNGGRGSFAKTSAAAVRPRAVWRGMISDETVNEEYASTLANASDMDTMGNSEERAIFGIPSSSGSTDRSREK